MKRNPAIAIIMCLLVSFTFSACAPAAPSGQTPEFFHDIGKTLSELKKEHPEGELIVRLDGSPDSAAICFGDPEAEYLYYFFGTQSGDAEKAMNECEDQLKCAGVITRAKFLFPDMDDEMSFEDFFSLIGVDEYEYFGDDDDTITAAGWLRFQYRGMEVMINTNEADDVGVYSVFAGAERVRYDAPASIVDLELLAADQNMVDTVMFD